MLKCIQDFAQGEHRYAAGDVVQTHPAVESWLLDSFPAYFERVEDAAVEPEAKDIETPPEDKMIRQPAKRK